MNRSGQVNIVVVEIFDEKDWKAPGDTVVEEECKMYFGYLFLFYTD